LADGQCQFSGEHYQVNISDEYRLGPLPEIPPPLVASAGGPRNIRESTPLVDRIEIKASARGTRGGALDFTQVATVTEDEVKENVRRLGEINAAEFHKGWFSDTLPHHEGDIVLAFWDVDFYSSLHDCLQNLWPCIVDGGYIFLDEYKEVPYASVFYSEKYWSKYFDIVPPGLIGIGTGVQVGMHFTDFTVGMRGPKIQSANSTAYCLKGTRAIWEYYPDEDETIGQPASN